MPALSWLLARDEIVSILTGVAITDPAAVTLAKVYENHRNQITDFPCVIIMGASKPDPVRSSGLREREVVVRLRLVMRDADLHRTEAMLDAFEEAITTVLDNNLSLNGKVSNLNGPAWEEADTLDVGGQSRAGADALVTFRMLDDPGFAG
jgi:hypothetical protein